MAIHKKIKERQSEVQKSGDEWEIFVMEYVNKKLEENNSDIRIIRGKEVQKNSPIWERLAIPVGEKEKIWGDIDLIALKGEEPIAVISCKISLHGRLSETLFYAVVLKDMIEDLKVAFATSDKGRQQKAGVFSSEWGSEEKPTKDRQLASKYLDGVYIYNKNTNLGGKIKMLEELPKDLEAWSKKLATS